MSLSKAIKLIAVGQSSGLKALLGTFEFIGGVSELIAASCRRLLTRPFYPQLVAEQCYSLGVKSLSIAFITALSTGAVMSLQFGYGLERFGGKPYVPRVVGLSIFRELGPVLTCLMISGRVGSGIAAEIASMKVTQQIDAIRALGTDPIRKLVIPRVLALIIMTPLITGMADLFGVLGGMAISATELNIHPDFYLNEGLFALRSSDFTVGIAKTFFFAIIIGFTGCYYGLKTEGGTQGVGQATTHAVVTGSILITIFDFVLTKFFWIFESGLEL
ncbi:MAG: ABC transporter permease [Deltaproteobacteria bacterium]|nr:ABC transporter permease [Deltaproteobacteria bacterium]MBI3295214.1 ABC transporter permease [Deltaproteobacteria bacterium]